MRRSGADVHATEMPLRDATQRLRDMLRARRHLYTSGNHEIAEILGVTDGGLAALAGQVVQLLPPGIRAGRSAEILTAMGLDTSMVTWCRCGSGPLVDDATMCKSCSRRTARGAHTRDQRRLRLLSDIDNGQIGWSQGKRRWTHTSGAPRSAAIRQELDDRTVIVVDGTLRLTDKGRRALEAAAAEQATTDGQCPT